MTKQPHMQKNFAPGSSRSPRSARTLLLRMAADQDRADRIRALKKEHPETKWQAIADHIGVTQRAAQSWQETGAIAYDNAKKLAELWGEELDYIMRGVRRGEVDLMGSLDGDGASDPLAEQLTSLETKLDEALSLLRALAADRQLADVDENDEAAGGQASSQAG